MSTTWPKADTAVLLAALATAALLGWYLAAHVDCINSDGVQYITIARHLYRGEWWQGLANYFPPGYPLVIAAAHVVIDDWERAGTVVSYAAGLLTFAPLVGLARLLPLGRHERAALMFGYALCPYPARYASQVRSEALYGLVLLTAVWLVARFLAGGSRRLPAVAGLLIGFAYLIRPEGLGLIFPLGAAVALSIRAVGRGYGQALREAAVAAAAAALVAAPYVLYLRVDTGRWLASRKVGMVLTTALKERTGEGTIVGMEESQDQSLVELIAAHPSALAHKVAIDSGLTLVAFSEALYYAYVPFLLLGIVIARRGYDSRANLLLHSVVWFYVFAMALLYVNRRYYTPLVPLAMIWCAIGFAWSWRRLREWRREAATALLVITVAAILAKALRIPGEDLFPRRFGEEIARAGSSGALVIAPVAQVAFYAGGRDLRAALPIDRERLEHWTSGGGAWLVVREGDLTPEAQAFLDHSPDIELVATAEEKKNPRLYRLGGPGATATAPQAGDSP